MLARFRLLYHEVFSPVARLMIRVGLTANAVTTLGLLSALVTSYFILISNHALSLVFLLLTIFLDGLDGLIAKMTKPSKFGDFYDAFIDRVVEIVLFGSIAIAMPKLSFLSLSTLALSLLVSYIPARAEVWTIGVRIRYRSIGSRAERMVVLFLGFLFMQIETALYIMVLLSVVAIVQRFFITYSNLRKL